MAPFLKLLLHIKKQKDWFPDDLYDWSVDNFGVFFEKTTLAL